MYVYIYIYMSKVETLGEQLGGVRARLIKIEVYIIIIYMHICIDIYVCIYIYIYIYKVETLDEQLGGVRARLTKTEV